MPSWAELTLKGATLELKAYTPETRLVMFDMDWTLIDVTVHYGQSMAIAIRQIYGVERRVVSPSLAGNTMANIMRIVLRDNGVAPENIEPQLQEALQLQAETCIAALEEDLRPHILPGVVELLEALEARGHFLTVVSGTLGPISRVVLQRSGLDRHFAAMTFGEEGNERVDLLRLLLHRAREQGFTPAMDKVVAVGDTTHDITAAKAIGARVVAVATGRDTPELLSQFGPDAILRDFTDCQAALDAIVGADGHMS